MPEANAADDAQAPYGPRHRQQAQEVISAHIRGDLGMRDALLAEYCCDEHLLACFLDFFFASVVAGPSNTAVGRFHFLQWMLGDVLEAVAKERERDLHQMCAGLVATDFEGLPPSMERAVRAAQTTMVSHLLARSGRQPWGIQDLLSAEALGQLVVGVHILLWVLCFDARDELGDARIIAMLLPHVTRVLQMSADAEGLSLEQYTADLWLLHLRMDAGLRLF